MNHRFEIKSYTLDPPFSGQYTAIFKDDVKTNFWARQGDFEELEKLSRYLNLLQTGVIDPDALDSCSSFEWTPESYRVLVNPPDDQLPHWTRQLFTISSGEKTSNEIDKYIERGMKPLFTQYSKVLKPDLSGINKKLLIVVFPYSVVYYSE